MAERRPASHVVCGENSCDKLDEDHRLFWKAPSANRNPFMVMAALRQIRTLSCERAGVHCTLCSSTDVNGR